MKTNYSLPFLSLLVLSASLTPSLLQAGRHDDQEDHSTAVIVGSAVAGAFAAAGAYALGSWLTSPSDGQLMEDARRAYRDAENEYKDTFHLYYSVDYDKCADFNKETFERSQDKHDEIILSAMAQRIMVQGNQSMSKYSKDMYRAADRLAKQRSLLIKRMPKLECNCMYKDMESMARDLADLDGKLRTVAHFISQHRSYFSLCKTEQQMLQKYGREIAAFDEHRQNRESYMREIRAAVMRYGKQMWSPYPYLAYVDTISSDKQKLDDKIGQLEHTYAQRKNFSKALSSHLDAIKNEIMADGAYAQALRDRERDRIERERIQAQENQARLLAENQRLMYELAREQQRPQVVIVEHTHIPPMPVYHIHHNNPAVILGYEHYDEDGSVFFGVEI